MSDSNQFADVSSSTTALQDPGVTPPVDSSQAEQAPVAESQTATESNATTEPVTTESATTEPVAAATTEEAVAPRPKVQLNPTLSPELQASESNTSTTRGPIEIPKSDDLDADIEAQLNAALNKEPAPAPKKGGHQGEAQPYVAPPEEELEPGVKLKGQVQAINGDDVLVELGYRMTGLVAARQFNGKLPAIGDTLDVVVESIDANQGMIMLNNFKGVRKIHGNWDALAVGMTVECMVTGTNKGGLNVTVSNIRAFLPKSQVDISFIENLEALVGQKLQVKVTDVNPAKRNLVVSRKQVLAEEREAVQQDAWGKIQEGQEVLGTVKTVKEYGAFIDLGGVDGLLHVGEMSWNRINHPQDMLQVGQQVNVKILKIDTEKKKISLGMKQLISNPWEYVETRYPKGADVTGTVSRLIDFGAFVELEPGVEGLIHISELEHRRVNTVQDVVKVGQEVTARVLEVSKNKRRISLSMKALLAKPEPVQQESAADDKGPKAPPRKQRNDLKGGRTTGFEGGGMFGNPRDFK
jgi:small subunit ribosomal protein S1